jgi:hypothetical protein
VKKKLLDNFLVININKINRWKNLLR